MHPPRNLIDNIGYNNITRIIEVPQKNYDEAMELLSNISDIKIYQESIYDYLT